ncbi:hypothetical protein QJU89_04030 [Pasteurella skyensis]|uniref:Uncharacterized protein n=1 Tax=Phocoenobacter skyensis TaxID=97481 RepID=A0AAJ6P034_9PAST|nr:hypothetical protein [Pasteurella skyensis]MDP8162002.1 hypothetical protein [Pasteurella skyensis]MDP8172158.1 hypothetical protein [Pasteurella skyensis]MDP8176494.1 hypothetical protein [Pasteurella skyensis]MDP8178382.1 hypothetical protein [Pasteurella skyensis]MDP8182862.1 hypothetical protein [Pasteurella skyensis]
MKKEAKESKLAKAPKRDNGSYIGWVLAFFLCILYGFHLLIDSFEKDRKIFPKSCDLTPKQFEKAVWREFGKRLLEKQRYNYYYYDGCRTSDACQIWVIDKKYSRKMVDNLFVKYYKNIQWDKELDLYTDDPNTISMFILPKDRAYFYKSLSMEHVYFPFLKSINATKYIGGDIDFNQSSLIVDRLGSLSFFEKEDIKISKNKLDIYYTTSFGNLLSDDSRLRSLNNILFKNSYTKNPYPNNIGGKGYMREDYEVSSNKIDSCGRVVNDE